MHGNFGAFIRAGALLLVLAFSLPAAATNVVVGPGNCNYNGFATALTTVDASGSGLITFNCGTATITFTSLLQIHNTVTIDGGGTITFDGGNNSGFFQVSFGAHALLKRLTLQHGAYVNGQRALENFGTLKLDHARVINNVSTRGPLLNYGTLDVSWSTLSGNAANSVTLSGDGIGGAIENSNGDLDVRNSTFNGNTALRNGGAIFSDSTMKIENSTFNGNAANGTGSGGGAIYQTGAGNSTITFATIVGNTAVFGAGVYNDGAGSSTLTIAKSIVSGNADGNCDGVLATGGYNLSNGTGCGSVFVGTGDLINQTLNMGALAANGGPTQTMLPAAGNPAINHVPGSACSIPFDQRGGSRPFGAGCDSGAVEVGAAIDLIFYDDFD